MIEVRDLLKRHGGTTVLQELNFNVPERALTAIIGPNGAGKSTLLSLVSRLMPITEGQVLVAGRDVATTPTEALARIMAILRQDNQSALRLTVRDLVGFGRFPHSKGRLGPEDVRHVDEALEYLQLTPLAERFLDELSGGQRQRAYIAMVLCQDTPFILLDEPLNNLDMAHAVSMMGLLRRAVTERGKTVVMVLHDINFASWYSDHIVAMKHGRVVAQGLAGDIIQPEALSAIYEMDIEVHTIGGQKVSLYYG